MLMHLGLHRIILAKAARFCNEFDVSRFGKISDRGLRSTAAGNSANSHIKVSDKEGGKLHSMNSSTYEEEFPSLSRVKSRIDIVTCSDQNPKASQNAGPLQCASSNLITCSEQKPKMSQNAGPSQCAASNLITCFEQYTEEVHSNDLLHSMNSSTYKEEFPPLSRVKSRRTTSIDIVTCSEQKPKVSQNVGPLESAAASNFITFSEQKPEVSQNVGPLESAAASNLITCSEQYMEEVHSNDPLQGEASTSISDFYDTDLPTSFGKKKKALSSSRKPKICQTYHEPRQAKRKSKPSSSTPMDEPFDICPPETTESTSSGGSVNKRNSGMWSPARELAEENEITTGIEEEGFHIEDLFEDSGMVLRSGMVVLKRYIPLSEQMNIVNKCRELGCGRGGFYRPGYNDGAKLRLYMMCLGLDWNPQTKSYGERRQHDNAPPPRIPYEFTSLVCRALDDSHNLIERYLKVENVEDELPKMCPDVCIVNFYTSNGRLGLHQDRDESKESLDKRLPVVSISIGDSAEFLYGDERDANKAESILLESGDVLIFGGKSRHIYHGVKTIIPETAPSALRETTKLLPGRLNLTFRKN